MSFLPRGRRSVRAYQRKDKVVAEVSASTGDLALLYVSRWKTPQAARVRALLCGCSVTALSQRDRAGVQAVRGRDCPISIGADHDGRGSGDCGALEDNSVIVRSFDTGRGQTAHGFAGCERGAMHAESLPQKRLDCGCLRFRRFQEFTREIGDGCGGNEARAGAPPNVYWNPKLGYQGFASAR